MAQPFDFRIGRNDTRPKLRRALLDADSNPVDITNNQGVVFNMTVGAIAKINRGVCTVVANYPAEVEYDWSGAGDTDTAGNYLGEFEVTLADGGIETFPNGPKIRVQVFQDLG